MTRLLVRECGSLFNIRHLSDFIFDAAIADNLRIVLVGTINKALTMRIAAKPKSLLSALEIDCGAAHPTSSTAPSPCQREICSAGVVPDFDGLRSKQPQFPVIDNQADDVVEVGFCLSKIQGIKR